MKNCFHCVMYESHRCRNMRDCPEGLHYEEYTGSAVRQCLCATIEVFQDGYIHCPILDSIGCEKCTEDFGDGFDFYHDESQNYERLPKWDKREGEELAKKTYYTKCGRQFEKSSTAVVTGYTIDENDKECADCPFQVDVKEGWPPVHKRWECRAGSEKPNHTNDWVGSIEDKNTVGINSLDNNFLESIIEYCKEQADVSANYNADHLADCRRTLTIICNANKKGIAAKKALIEKFFSEEFNSRVRHCPRFKGSCGEKGAGKMYIDCDGNKTYYGKSDYWNAKFELCTKKPDHCCLSPLYKPQGIEVDYPIYEAAAEMAGAETCENCEFSEDYGESVEYIKCHEGKKGKDVRKKQPACHNYVPVSGVVDDEPEGDLEEQLDELLSKGDAEDRAAKDRELLSTLIGKEIRTHYNTGGIVTNIIGPHSHHYGPEHWTINYTKDGKRSKSPFIINSIKVKNGIITCDGKPLQIVDHIASEVSLNAEQNYTYRGLV